MRQAEEAAERARSRDNYSYEIFDIEHHAALVERLRFERALRDAFADGNLQLHYQPEYDADQHGWIAAEALLRWRDGDRLVVAADFIEVAETSALILPIGSWVLRRACLDAAQWPATAGGGYPTVRVNVSARQFDDSGLLEDVTAALADSGLRPERLCLEITETTLMRDIDRALDLLQQLKASGVQVAIDDFGTGYASLVYLKRLPVDVLKIDRSFVEGIPGNAADTAIVAAVFGLAESLGIEVVAEGVERIEQQHALQAIGVRRMQGWLYARAMDQSSVCQWLVSSPG
jgi:EAL domain-containing protein (putative c-di-GMP-specific phosphodiesterase class I)